MGQKQISPMDADLNSDKISIDVVSGKLSDIECDVLVVGMSEGEKLSGEMKAIDEAIRGEISTLFNQEIFKGEWKQHHSISTLGMVKPKRILLFGLGKDKDLNAEKLRKASGWAAKSTRAHKAKTLATNLHTRLADRMDTAAAVTEGIILGNKTFRWQGFYEFDMNEAKTIRTELNSLESYKVKVPENYKNAKYIFLANIDPELQLDVINNIKKPELVIMDTMNFWIEHKREQLLKTIDKSDIIVLNDGEARQLFDTPNLVKSANAALKLHTRAVIIKKGEHGALLFTDSKHFNAPGYPLENIKDPTGCGDSFGGALIGYLSKTKDLSETNLRKAVVYGSVLASFNAEDFSIERLRNINSKDIEERYKEFKDMGKF